MTGRARLLPMLLLIALAQGDIAFADLAGTPVRVDHLDGFLELGVRGRNDRRSREGAGTDFNGDQLTIDEILHLDSVGSFWDPRLVRYRASLDLHFLQRLLNNGNNLFLPGGDLRLNFLEKKPYGLTVFGRVVETEVEQSFGRSLESRLTAYGGGLRFQLGPIPFRVGYLHRFQKRTGSSDALYQQETDQVDFLGTYRFREGSDGDIRYLFADEVLSGQPSRRHDFTANNLTYFDSEKRKRFTGNVRYYDWKGRTDSSEASLYGEYDWQHTDDLRSRYRFDYAHMTFDQLASDLYDAQVTLSHRLYGSLASDATLFANYTNATGGDIGQYGLEIVERYTKRLGRWGKLGIGLAPQARLLQQRPDGGGAFVLDERVLFPPSDRAELRQLDIDVSTIVVTSPDSAITYDEGLDYTVNEIDRRTEIERIDTGSIPIDGLVLVDYRYQARAENDLVVYGARGDLEWSYRDWGTFFVDVRTKREHVVSGNRDQRLDDRDRQEFGLRAGRRWIRGLVSFDWERWDDRSSNGNLQQLYLSTPWPGRWQASVSASHRARYFTNPNEDMDRWRVYGRFTAPLGRNGTVELDPEYTSEIWKSAQKPDARSVDLVGATLSLRWYFRALELRGGASLFRVWRTDNTGMYDRFFFRVRRYF